MERTKFKRILVEGEKFKLQKLPSKDFSLFSSQRRACPVLKHSQVSEVFKGFRVHDLSKLRSKKLRFKMEIKLSLEMCQICDRCSLEYFAMFSRLITLEDGPTMLEV